MKKKLFLLTLASAIAICAAACTNMPRFGAHAILDEKQIRHIVALLLDPKSPVNAE